MIDEGTLALASSGGRLVDASVGELYGPAAAAGPKAGRLLAIILRRWRLVALTMLVLNGLAWIAVSSITPRYTAEADLLVGPREEQVVDLKAVLSGLGADSDVVESEIQVLRSRGLARGIVERFRLDGMSQFNPALHRPGLLADLQGAAARYLAAHVPGKAPVPPPAIPAAPGAVQTPYDSLSIATDAFLRALDVAAKGRSRVIGVRFTATSPALAATLTNAVADAYIASQLKAKTDATAQAQGWLDQRVVELRHQMVDADGAVAAYRRRSGLVRGREASLLTEQMSELGTGVIRAQENVAVAQARLAAVAGINPNAQGLRQDVAAAVAQERQLAGNLDKLRSQSGAGSESEIELQALQQEADADRALYERLLSRSKETQIESGLQQADAKLVSRAEWPQEPSYPNKAVILPALFVASALFAALLVLAVESLDHGFGSIDELEAAVGLPAIGIVPLLRRGQLRRAPPDRHVLEAPTEPYAEAIRRLYLGLMPGKADRGPRVVMMTSALPGEGKSTLTLSMGRLMARGGKRVVIVDCNLQHPALHHACGAPVGPGLIECLTGEVDADDVIQGDPVSPAHFMGAGTFVNAAPDLLASAEMRRLMKILSQRYDIVLLDCAPVLGGSDTLALGRLVDRVVFVVHWQQTRGHAVMAALRQLVQAGSPVAGMVLSMVDTGKIGTYAALGINQRPPRLYLAQQAS